MYSQHAHILVSACTDLPVAAIIIKARNTITAYSIPASCNWPQVGRGKDEGDDPSPVLHCDDVVSNKDRNH